MAAISNVGTILPPRQTLCQGQDEMALTDMKLETSSNRWGAK